MFPCYVSGIVLLFPLHRVTVPEVLKDKNLVRATEEKEFPRPWIKGITR
jgi:hypothetical protein